MTAATVIMYCVNALQQVSRDGLKLLLDFCNIWRRDSRLAR